MNKKHWSRNEGQNIGWEVLESQVQSVRAMLSYQTQVERLRLAESEAEQAGDLEGAMSFFTARMEVIIAGPGNSQALQMAGR